MPRKKKEKISSEKTVKKEKAESEEVSEIFEVEKNGKEKTIEAHGIEIEKKPSEEQLKGEKKTLIAIIIIVLGLAAMFFLVYYIMYLINHFEVDGVKFEVDKTDLQGQTVYKTSIPGIIYNGTFIAGGTGGQKADYNFYLRDDPRTTNEIPFNGSIVLTRDIVLNQKSNFKCNGDYIGIANLLQIYNAIGAKVISDENASCDSQGRYIYINIQEANETDIEQFGPTCYNINVKNCEILPVTEKMMIETLSYIDGKI